MKEQGVDPALAYVAAKRVGILDQVRNRQAAARQRNRDDLQPLLTSAGLYAAKGEAEPARALYQEVLELEPEWPAALNGNRWFLIEQGDLAVVRGRLPDAGRDFAQAKALAKRLAGLEPDNRNWQRNVAVTWSWIGDVETAQGHVDAALAAYERYYEDIKRLAAADPSSAGWQRDLAVSHYRLGGIADRQGRKDLLRQHWGEMLAIFAAMQQRGLHVSPEDLAGLETIRARVQGAAR